MGQQQRDEALDHARLGEPALMLQAHGREPLWPPSVGGDTPGAVASTPRSGLPALRPITYTQTKHWPLDPRAAHRHRLVSGVGTDPVTTAYKMLRTQILQRTRQHGWKTLAITSPGFGEGKTLTAVNLAITLAREVNRTVLLIDSDLQRPSVAACFGYAPSAGLADYLAGSAALPDLLVNPGIERLVILPGRGRVENSSEALSSPKMIELVQELRDRYPERLVVIDLPPLLVADDALAFSPYVDAMLLVAEEGKTSRDDLRRAVKLLDDVNIIGTVLNKSTSVRPASHGN